MFVTTFLGHQGWMIRAGRSCVLVDPLLAEDFGDAHALGYRVHPPRVLRPEAFPAIDAVIISHEHDDHFDVPSLALLDRAIPVYMSAHSSRAAFGILERMGFDARPLVPGAPLDIGDLQLVPFSGDHVNVNCADEWDALPFLIRDREGAGSLFSMVDIALLPVHAQWARAYAPRPGLVTWSNNALDWSHMSDEPEDDGATERCFQAMGNDRKLIATLWGKPAAMLVCAGGFAFRDERAWLNERVFATDAEAACAKLGRFYPDERCFAALPGQTFRMRDNRLVGVEDSAPFLALAPREQWPSRARRERGNPLPDYEPATGRRRLSDDETRRLPARLANLAGALVGGILFRSLHSMLASEAGGRKPTFALVLRQGTEGATMVFEYDACACAFVPSTSADPRADYLGGFECWGTDLLAVLDGEIGPLALMFGRARTWNALPRRFLFDLLEGLARMCHPLSRPADVLRVYERQWSRSRAVEPVFRGAAAAPIR